MRSICSEDKNDDAHVRGSQKLGQLQMLPPLPHGAERHYTCAFLQSIPLLAECVCQPAVAIPRAEAVMSNETQASDKGETGTHPGRMCNTPEDLTPELGMSRDSGDTCFIHTKAWFLNGGDLEKVEGGWVKQEEGEEGEGVDGGVHEGEGLDGPELAAVVAVGDEIGDEEDSGGEGKGGEKNAIEALAGVRG